MFNPDEPHNELEELIVNHIAAMASMTEGSEEYTAAADQLKTLMETRKIDQETDKIDEEAEKLAQETRQIQDQIDNPWRPSADQLVTAGATLVAVTAMLAFEMRGVITSKTFSWIPKPR